MGDSNVYQMDFMSFSKDSVRIQWTTTFWC